MRRDGKQLTITDADGKLTDPARWLIGGLAQMGGALMAFGNRFDGSFARLHQGKEAPRSIVWGDFDRSALIRIPVETFHNRYRRTAITQTQQLSCLFERV